MSKYISVKIRRFVYNRDSFSCRYCSKPLGKRKGDLSLDHVIPRSKGGHHTIDNLVTSCAQCQWKKGSKYLSDTQMKLVELVN